MIGHFSSPSSVMSQSYTCLLTGRSVPGEVGYTELLWLPNCWRRGSLSSRMRYVGKWTCKRVSKLRHQKISWTDHMFIIKIVHYVYAGNHVEFKNSLRFNVVNTLYSCTCMFVTKFSYSVNVFCATCINCLFR